MGLRILNDRTTLSSSHVRVVNRGLYGVYVLKTLHQALHLTVTNSFNVCHSEYFFYENIHAKMSLC